MWSVHREDAILILIHLDKSLGISGAFIFLLQSYLYESYRRHRIFF